MSSSAGATEVVGVRLPFFAAAFFAPSNGVPQGASPIFFTTVAAVHFASSKPVASQPAAGLARDVFQFAPDSASTVLPAVRRKDIAAMPPSLRARTAIVFTPALRSAPTSAVKAWAQSSEPPCCLPLSQTTQWLSAVDCSWALAGTSFSSKEVRNQTSCLATLFFAPQIQKVSAVASVETKHARSAVMRRSDMSGEKG